jgi:isoquinoline 1-oxidoreductase alpha subunit
MVKLTLNDKPIAVNATPDTPLLWVIREELNLTGTKFGCGIAQCGACTVHLDGQPVRSCSVPVGSVAGRRVTTIEGLMQTRTGKALEAAWNKEQTPQCGYCQSGQLMSAAHLLQKNKAELSRTEILQALSGNLCRCGTYNHIASAVSSAQKTLQGSKA